MQPSFVDLFDVGPKHLPTMPIPLSGPAFHVIAEYFSKFV